MKSTSQQFLDLFFKPGEQVCVSHDGYGYKSVEQGSLNGDIEMLSPNENVRIKHIKESQINLISINPVNGFRRDENVTAWRSFMVELDDGTAKEQMDYIKGLDMPYSICVFSGNKSLHFGIVLDEDLPSEGMWRDVAEWILNIASKADQVAKNPTRSIRFPGNIRLTGKKEIQKLIEIKGKVKYADLAKWLQKHPKLNPAEIRKYVRTSIPKTINGIPEWVLNKLSYGIDESRGRNNEWFSIGMELAKSGFNDQEIIDYAQEFFVPERDFTVKEWKSIMQHAYRRALRKT